MTAELSDAFRTKREGVAFVLAAAEDALGDRPLSVLTTTGELVSDGGARARPWDVAAANWVATALAVAGAYPDALLIDVGSTTADIVPIAAGRVAATGHNDLERLLAGELVYTGVLRTNLAAIAPRVPVRGGWCPVSSEYFAISADVHLVLGHLAPEAYDCPTPDGRPATVAFARERIARLVCSDVDQLDAGEIDAIAAFLARRAAAPDRGGGPPGAASAAARGAGRRGRRRRVPGRARSPRAWDEPSPALRRRGARPARRWRPPRRWRRCWRHACADRRQGRRRSRRRRAAGAVHRARRARGAPSAARRARRRGFADAVRDADRRFGLRAATSHRMAILGMEQFGWLLSDLIPGAVRCADLAAGRAGRTTVLLPAALPLDALPASWQVTSDSIAAWVADQVGAGRLVLVKDVDGLFADWPPRGEPIARLTRRRARGAAGRGRGRVPAHGARRRALRDVGDRRARPRARGGAARTRHDRGHADRRSALATLRPWLTSGSGTPGLRSWPTPSSGTTRSWAASTRSRTAASGPTSSPASWPACSGIRWPSTSRRTPASGRSSRTSAAAA